MTGGSGGNEFSSEGAGTLVPSNKNASKKPSGAYRIHIEATPYRGKVDVKVRRRET